MDILPRENELQKMLADEKIRSDEHKNNYLKVKAQYTSLQGEYVSLQDELRSTIECAHDVQEKNSALLDHTRKELASKAAEIEELTQQLPSEQSMQILKTQISDDLEQVYKIRVQKIMDENEAFRQECNKLKYEVSFMKAEYEHSTKIHAQEMNETKLRHQAEVINLRKEREALQARFEKSEEEGELQRIRVLQRQNAQLNLKVKGLLTELEEIRAQREHLGVQADNVTRVQVKQLAQNQANIRTLDTELSTAKQQIASLERELSSVTSQHTTLMEKIHSLQKENSSLRSTAETVEYQSKLDVTNCKMQALKDQGEIERHRDRLVNEVAELKSQIEVITHSLEKQKEMLVQKERESVKQIQAAREEEWQKLHQAENEKLELETRIQELARRKIDFDNEQQALKVKYDDKVAAMMLEKDNAEKEVLVLRSKIQKQDSISDSFERLSSEHSDLKNRYQRLETEYNSFISSEAELLDTNQRLQSKLNAAEESSQQAKQQLHEVKQKAESQVTDYRSEWTQEKLHLQRRLDELDVQMKAHRDKTEQLTQANKKKKQHYAHIVDKLRDKITLLQAKLEHTMLERDALKKSVPTELHINVKKQLNDLLRRHREYSHILHNIPAEVSRFDLTGDLSDLDIRHQTSTPINHSIIDVENDALRIDLAHLKERLNILDDNQQQQLGELQNVTKATTYGINSPPPLGSPIVSPRDTDKDRETEKQHHVT